MASPGPQRLYPEINDLNQLTQNMTLYKDRYKKSLQESHRFTLTDLVNTEKRLTNVVSDISNVEGDVTNTLSNLEKLKGDIIETLNNMRFTLNDFQNYTK